MDSVSWVSVIGAIGTVLLQLLHMWLSYKRDTVIKSEVQTVKSDVQTVAQSTNGLTDKIITAEVTAERLMAKAEVAANTLILTAAKTAREMKEK